VKAFAPALKVKPRTERVAVFSSGAIFPVVPKATVSPERLPLGATPPSQLAALLKVTLVVVDPTPPHTFSTAWAEGMAAVMAMVNTHAARLMEELGAKRLNLEFFIICVF
jgi:hypothetical protein